MILARASAGYLRRHHWQAALAVLGIALGVAVVVAVNLANQSAQRAFDLSTEAVTGRATHQIVGGPAGLPEALYRQLRVEQGIRALAPIVTGSAQAPSKPGLTVRILGVDPLAEGAFRAYTARAGEDGVLGELLVTPGAVLTTPALARQLQVSPGESFQLSVAGQPQPFTLLGHLEPRREVTRQGLSTVVITDIASAQERLDRLGRLSRIDVIMTDDKQLAELQAALPPQAEVIPTEARSQAMSDMTESFRLNLQALSLLALVVGLFLIYNTMSFSVIRRRALLGTLRALGVTRGQLYGLVAAEAVVLGLAGTALGLALGWLLAQGLVRLVAQTLNDLYFTVTVEALHVTPWVLLQGVLLGVGAALLAAAWPAWEAASTPPRAVLSRSLLEQRLRWLVPRAALAGLGLSAAGGVVLMASSQLWVSFAGLFAVVLGAALMTPLATVVLMQVLAPIAGRWFGVAGRMAVHGVTAALSRTGVAVAALAVAVAATVGVGLMVDSFRHTVSLWLHQTMQADVYISAAGDQRGALAPEVVQRAAEVEGVSAVSKGQRVTLTTAQGPVALRVLEPAPASRQGFRFKSGKPDEAWAAWQQDGAVLVSEPYAHGRDLQVGDQVRLRTASGDRALPVAGIFYDYSSDRGFVLMGRSTYERHFGSPAFTGLGIYAAPGVSPAVLVERLRAQLGPLQPLDISDTRSLREASLAVFDRTFAITNVLRLLAVVVAFVGVLSALSAIQLERGRELGVLRTLGLTPGQLWGLLCGETGLLGLAAGLVAVALGVVMALVLILVVNRQAFGWTLQVVVDAGILAQGLGLAVIAALLAGMIPAWRMAQTPPAGVLREE